MKIFVGADHRGYRLKAQIINFLKNQGHRVVDVGTDRDIVPCDYPKISCEVASKVVRQKGTRGILICMSGIGHSIAANKIPGAYAALCFNKQMASLSRKHNNSNILVIGSKFIADGIWKEIITVWLKTKFEGGRHLLRVKQIKQIEKEFSVRKR